LRRIRFSQRSPSSGNTGINRVAIPQEISALKPHQMSLAVMGIEYMNISDKVGAILSRFDVKCDRGSTPVELRLPLGELLKPCFLSESDFTAAFSRFHGLHQKAQSSFDLSLDTVDSTKTRISDVPKKIIKHAKLRLIGDESNWSRDSTIKLAGMLPESEYQVLVVVEINPNTGIGKIVVCCEDTMTLNALMSLLKKAITA